MFPARTWQACKAWINKYEEACLFIDSTDDKPKQLAFHLGNKLVLHRLPMSHFFDGPSQNKKCEMGAERHTLPGLEARCRLV